MGRKDPYAAVSQSFTFEVAEEDQIRPEQLVARLTVSFAAVALIPAVVDQYSVMAYQRDWDPHGTGDGRLCRETPFTA